MIVNIPEVVNILTPSPWDINIYANPLIIQTVSTVNTQFHIPNTSTFSWKHHFRCLCKYSLDFTLRDTFYSWSNLGNFNLKDTKQSFKVSSLSANKCKYLFLFPALFSNNFRIFCSETLSMFWFGTYSDFWN